MRGFLQPAVRVIPNEDQKAFAALSRGRRSKLAAGAQTNLLKADQWARGAQVGTDVSEALESAFRALQANAKKK